MPITVADLSESALLDRILPRLQGASTEPSLILVGPGDDAAVLSVPDGRLVMSIDTQVQDMDFRLAWPNGYRTTGFNVGWKAAAQNLSDINAMGAQATSMVVSLTLPGYTEVSWVEGLADGLVAAMKHLGAGSCRVIGGDLGAAREIVVTAAVTGSLEGKEPVLRDGAQPGDVVALAGTVGRAAAGLSLLESQLSMESLPADAVELVTNQLQPLPPLKAGPAAATAGATAMLDISDGLIRDAHRLAVASKVKIDFNPGVLATLADQLEFAGWLLDINPMGWVLGGGEDHGLLATFPSTVALPEPFVAIGRVLEGSPGVTVGSQPSETIGWDHFAG